MIGLALKNLWKHPLRLVLTAGALATAIFLLCVLRSLVVALDAGVREAKSDRLIVQSAVSLFVNLPESYEEKIASVPGVAELAKWQWFGAFYREQKNFFAQFAVDPEKLLPMYDEIRIVDGAVDRFLTERTACILGRQTAEKYGFKVGDSVPLTPTIFPRADGETWQFTVVAIYESTSPNVDGATLFFPFEYLSESLRNGASEGPEGVGIFVLLLDEGADRVAVMSDVDALFENGPQRVRTTSEAEFNSQFVSMMGNVPFFLSSIGGGVLVAILLALVNTMLLAGREQTRDVGVLKALGFSDGAVFGAMLSQSMLLCILGGSLGIALALGLSDALTNMLGTGFPGYRVTPRTVAMAAGLTLGIGLLAGIVPAARARRLEVVEALRREI